MSWQLQLALIFRAWNDRFLTVDMRQRLRSAEAELVAEAKARAGTKVKTTQSRGRKPGGGPASSR
jgi:hypothetical protein